MSARLRGLLANLALLVASVALVVGLAEAALRLLARSARGGKEQRERNRYTEYDPLLGWRKTPGARVVYDRRDYRSEFTVNSRGLRGPERPYEKPAGTRRVLALGDSFVEAFMLDEARTVTARLEAHLAQGRCPTEVINGGTVGYSTDQEYLFHREEGRRYAPDVVVLFVYHNDIPYLPVDDYLGYPKPVLDFSVQPPRVANRPVPRYEPPPPVPPPPAPDGDYFHLLEFVKQGLEQTSARTYNRLADLGLWERLRKLPMNDELRLFHVPELGHLRAAWSAFTWTLQSLARAVAADGGRLLLVYVPSRMEVNESVWQLTEARYEIDAATFHRDAVARRLGYLSGRLELPYLDLTADLVDAEGFWTPTYFPTDSHWNARGQDVGARAVSRALVSEGLLPGCPGAPFPRP